jgi:hypothetical protein
VDQARRKPVLLDTGPLLAYLGWLYLDSIGASKATRDAALRDLKLGMAWSENQHERFDQFLKSRSIRLITSHVAAEILRFRSHSFLQKHTGPFTSFVLDHLGFFEERGVPIASLDKSLVVTFGLTDAGLVWLARQEGCTLVTSDDRLFRALPTDPKFEIQLLAYCGNAPTSRAAPVPEKASSSDTVPRAP